MTAKHWVSLLSLSLILSQVLFAAFPTAADEKTRDWKVSASHAVREPIPVGISNGRTGFSVALDVGHTLLSGGAKSASGVMEYQFNKRMAELILKDLQQAPGISPFIVDATGKAITLWRRAAIANEHHADLFLAIHHDSVNDRYLVPVSVNGETRYQTDRFHGYSIFFSQKNSHPASSFRFAKALGTALENEGLTPTRHHAEKIPGEGRDLIVPELGIYRFDDLVVLKGTQMPAVLLECGVIVNPAEEKDLNGSERQLKTVRAVREAILAMAEEHRQESPDSSKAEH